MFYHSKTTLFPTHNSMLNAKIQNTSVIALRSGLLSILLAHTAFAETTCPVSDSPVANPLSISADRLRVTQNQTSLLQGKVQLQQGQHHARSDRLTYDSQSKNLKLKGRAQYTNCDPRSPLWFVSAKEISYNTDSQKGLMKDSWLHFAGVPIFYLPRFRFTGGDDNRLSGFLTPKLSDSSDSGIETSMPIYFNIAPHKDVLFTPRYLSKRGPQLNLEGRYLYPLEQGSLKVSWIDDRRYDDERYAYQLNHQVATSDSFLLKANLQHVSDDRYLEDLGGSFNTYNSSYIRSYLESKWYYKGWNMRFEAERLNRADRAADRSQQPYQKRPQFAISKDFFAHNSAAKLSLFSEITDFTLKRRYLTDKDGERDYLNSGIRNYNELRVEWPYWRPGFHFTPALSISHTLYKLSNRSPARSTQKRTLPTFSMRSGLVFEKQSDSGRYRSTIEPEIFYLNVPYRNQKDIPIFDTDESEFRYSRMFETNRFNGLDRIGDADRMTFGLSHRLFHQRTGVEAMRFSVAKSYYFKDPNVTATVETRDPNINEKYNEKYNVAGEFSLNLNNKVRFLSSLIWNTRSNETVRNSANLSFRGADNRSLSLVYRQRRNDFEQAGIGFNMPINHSWSMFAEASYDLDSEELINAFSGVRYQACCWGMSVGVQRRLKNVIPRSRDTRSTRGRIDEGSLEYENFIGVELSLQGLNKIGNDIDSLLKESIFAH